MKKHSTLKLSILLLFTIVFCSCASDEKQDDSFSSPSVVTLEIKSIAENSAMISAKINSKDQKGILSYGICVSTEINPTLENIKVQEQGNTIATYSFSFQNLKPNTKHYTRAYIITNSGIIYGNELNFTTGIITKPIVTTALTTLVTSKTAVSGGIIINEGASKVTGYGVYISTTNVVPTTTDRDIQGILDSNKFTSALTNLEPNTKYYARAYAFNTSGISFGEVVTFTTEKVGLTSILTNQPSSIFTSTAKVGGTIVSDGGSKFSLVGVCISAVNPIPTIADAQTDIIFTSENAFEISLIDLKPATKYYIRAYGTNGFGTFYGEVVSFSTKEPGVPTLRISSLSGSGLIENSGALVTSNGGDVITSYGFVWSKFEDPDITWQNVSKTKQEGIFPNLNYFSGTLIDGIFPGTTHYVRAYATNSYGTGYSPALRFTKGKN